MASNANNATAPADISDVVMGEDTNGTQAALPEQALPAGTVPTQQPIPNANVVPKLCTMSACTEKPALASGEAHNALAMVSIIAPEAEDDDVQRAPLDIVCAVDRSGSMSGDKIQLMAETLTLLVTRAGLKATDRVGIVSFDHLVESRLELTAMDGDGKRQAQEVIRGLRPGGSTNLSGGLLQSIDMASNAPAVKSDAAAAAASVRTKAVLLFTDGHANHGIQSTPELVAATQGARGEAATAVFTFGYGADHNEDMLRAVASTANGLYYHITDVDDIPSAFADALGGIMSVVAQNATLTFACPAPEVGAMGKVLSAGYKVRAGDGGDAGRACVVELGDLYSEDAKDILFELSLPALPAARDWGSFLTKYAGRPPEAQRVLRASLRYFSVGTKRMEECAVGLDVSRPAATPEGQPVNIKLDEQRNRMAAAEAMEAAARLADAGDLAGGRQLLARARLTMEASTSALTPLSSGLVDEMVTLDEDYEDSARYRSLGSKATKMSAQSHTMQRSNHKTGQMYAGGRRGKGVMKSSWRESRGPRTV